MAMADYRRRDLCGGKTFYDVSLNWQDPDEEHGWAYWLHGLGDWAVLCEDCAKTHEAVIRRRSA